MEPAPPVARDAGNHQLCLHGVQVQHGVQGLGFRVKGLGLRVRVSGFRVRG